VPDAELWLGVDAGDTNIDAVVMDTHGHLVAKAKVAITADVHSGIGTAIKRVVGHPDVDRARITRATLGTASAVEAIANPTALTRVAVVRIGGPLTLAVPPLTTWPVDLRAAVSAGERVVGGGADYDGRAAAPLDEDALARFLATVGPSAEAVAITGVFSPVAPDQELLAAEIVRRERGAATHVSLSHEIGSVGLLERENAAVLNAALVSVIEDLARALDQALSAEGIDAEPFFAQNDGTAMALGHALRFPLLMVCSGPASGMRGAAFLSGMEEAVVVDVGGRSTNVGVLVHGFPRSSSLPTQIGGVPLNFRMPDFINVPFGGGSVVAVDESPPSVGPDSVAHRLVDEALVFGGRTATLTDVAVAAGRARIGSRSLTAQERSALARGLPVVDATLAEAVDIATASTVAPALVAVGGASAILADDLPGASEVIRPVDGDMAGAIGVAIAPVSGQADRICPNRPDKRSQALEEARAAACARAIHAGADPDRVEVVEVDEVPLTYLLDPAVRIRVRAAGPRI
jgi:N-methylhydantoinase A/oxoprolinase/acetone carboxylase beta subunit